MATLKPGNEENNEDDVSGEPGPSHGVPHRRIDNRRHCDCLVRHHINIIRFIRKFSTDSTGLRNWNSQNPNEVSVYVSQRKLQNIKDGG